MVFNKGGIGTALLLIIGAMASSGEKLEVIYKWKTPDYEFPSQESRVELIGSGQFIPENIAIIDVDVAPPPDNRTFVTTPRLKPGTPATVSSVGENGLLQPYPNWESNREGNCSGLTSVFRTQVDTCGRFWILDCGVVDIFTAPRKICPQKLVIFDLKTDQLIGQYQYPDSVLDPDSLLTTIKVDSRGGNCEDTFVYVADVVSFKLIVYDAVRQRSWRITSNFFYPYPLSGSFDINGVTFDFMDGIIGLALSPIDKDGDRYLYFHSLASVRESWVLTSIIRNESLFLNGNSVSASFKVSLFTRSSQSVAEDTSSSGALFFGLLSSNSIACWNPRTTYSSNNIFTVAKNNVTLQFASGLKIYRDTLWVLTSRLQNFIVNNVPVNEINYRVLRGNVKELTRGTGCDGNYSKPF